MSDPKELKISVIGLKHSGKTFALQNIEASVEDKRYGYPHDRIASLVPLGETKHYVREGRRRQAMVTEDTSTWTFRMTGLNNHGPEEYVMSIKDVPGEVFESGKAGPLLVEEHTLKDYQSWLHDAVGVVVLIAAPTAINSDKYEDLHNALDFVEQVAQREDSQLQRVAVAITMFELFLLSYGDMALDMASHPYAIQEILRIQLSDSLAELRDIATLRNQANLDIRFSAMSTFGFIPGIGCPNVAPDQPGAIKDKNVSCRPIKARNYYPHLVADPFIYSALGVANPYLFKLDELFPR